MLPRSVLIRIVSGIENEVPTLKKRFVSRRINVYAKNYSEN